ncbi:MAG: hypothetical protein GY749_43040 [Desulfobacteraceae bacterium]|nr:hypothetical protein [Desulfobacteraceae bacterium]
MRCFHSYGPVDCRHHFCVERNSLVQRCFEQMIGVPDEGGHFFTIWAPRQAGKTWLMRQVKKEIEKEYSDKFIIGTMSVQGVVLEKDDPPELFLKRIPLLFSRFFNLDVRVPDTWEALGLLFSKQAGLFEKPLILFIDEFDRLPPTVIDRIVSMFRDIYLDRENFFIHGLALIGVRAVLGVESDRGSPFNIQRSLHAPNLTKQETEDLFQQYQSESGQKIEHQVIEKIYESTRGQPGLVSWFGELLTEKYNPGPNMLIDMSLWEDVYQAAQCREWNNTLLNLIKKARLNYTDYVTELFVKSDIPFSIHVEWCNYLYLNGIIDEVSIIDEQGRKISVCCFSSPFVQNCLFDAFTMDFIRDRLPVLALDPLDDLSDVFDKPEPDIPALLERYKGYLKRLKAKGINPWKDQPRRSDMRYTEYVGHFHLYFWLRQAVEYQCVVSPEFPTGNGRVDLHLKCNGRQAVIEVKSYTSRSGLEKAKKQAKDYARKLKLPAITLAVFVPVEDEEVLKQLSGEQIIDSIRVDVIAVGWV